MCTWLWQSFAVERLASCFSSQCGHTHTLVRLRPKTTTNKWGFSQSSLPPSLPNIYTSIVVHLCFRPISAGSGWPQGWQCKSTVYTARETTPLPVENCGRNPTTEAGDVSCDPALCARHIFGNDVSDPITYTVDLQYHDRDHRR